MINPLNDRKDGQRDEKLKYFNGILEKMIRMSTEDF